MLQMPLQIGYYSFLFGRLKTALTPAEFSEMKCGTYQNLGVVLDFKGKETEAISWLKRVG